MKNSIKIVLGILAIIIASCSIFQEPDISNDTVILNSPYEGMKSFSLTTSFWWEPIDDANGYNLQIVSPSFDSIEILVIDTNLSSNKFVFTLNPGRYEWGVYAYNDGYSTKMSVGSFMIDSTEGVADQFVNLSLPVANFNTNSTKVLFKWDFLPMEASYILSIRDSSFSEENRVYQNSTDKNSEIVDLPEGKYTWGVMAYKDQSFSKYTKRYLIVDTTAPGQPHIDEPAQDYDTLSNSPYKISWSRKGTSLSAVSDIIWIHIDTITKPHKEFIVSDTEFNLTDANLSNGKYVIQIKSVDAAGNESNFSVPRILYLKKE